MTTEPLTDRDRDILALEQQWFQFAGRKESAIYDKFGISATRYYQLLGQLIDTEPALAHSPLVVKRLRRLRDQRQRTRPVRRLG